MTDSFRVEQQAVEMDPAYIDPLRDTPLHLESETIVQALEMPHDSIFGGSAEVRHGDHVALSKGMSAKEEATEAEERRIRCMALLKAGGTARIVTALWPDAQTDDAGAFYLNSPWSGVGSRRIRIDSRAGGCSFKDGRKKTLPELVAMASGLTALDAADRLVALIESPTPASLQALQRLMTQRQLDGLESAMLKHRGDSEIFDLTFMESDRFAGLVSMNGESVKWRNPTGAGILRLQGDRRDGDVFLTKDINTALQIPTLQDIQIVVCQGAIDLPSRWNLVPAKELLDFLPEEPIGFSGTRNLGGPI